LVEVIIPVGGAGVVAGSSAVSPPASAGSAISACRAAAFGSGSVPALGDSFA